MSNIDPDLRGRDYRNPMSPANWSSGSWIAGAVVAVLLLVAVGYVFSGHRSGNSSMVEHRAAAVDTTAVPVVPAKPLMSPAPAPSSATAPAASATPSSSKP